MNTETLSIVLSVGFPLLVGLLLVFWLRREMEVYALKRELSDLERGLSERIGRVESDVRSLHTSLQALAVDLAKTTSRIEGRLDELTARAREK